MHFRHPWYSIIHSLEQKFGQLAIPGLIRGIAVLQFLVVLLIKFQPGYFEQLVFRQDKIFAGEIWRLFTCVFIGNSPLIIVAFIMMMFLWFINDILEEAWGAYKTTLFVMGTIFLFIVSLFLIPLLGQPTVSTFGGEFFTSAMILAACAIAPNYEIRLMLVIPIKLKWLGWVVIAFALYMVFQLHDSEIGKYFREAYKRHLELYGLLSLALALTPYMLVFFPRYAFELKHRQQAAARRAKFEAAHLPEDEPFHRCTKCGKTEHDDPEAEFRIEDDDEEYCLDCLEKGVQPAK